MGNFKVLFFRVFFGFNNNNNIFGCFGRAHVASVLTRSTRILRAGAAGFVVQVLALGNVEGGRVAGSVDVVAQLAGASKVLLHSSGVVTCMQDGIKYKPVDSVQAPSCQAQAAPLVVADRSHACSVTDASQSSNTCTPSPM